MDVQYLALSAVLFFLGAIGVIIRRNAVVIVMSIELMLNAAGLAFVAARIAGGTPLLFLMLAAAVQAVTGLAVVFAFYRTNGTVDTAQADDLKL